MTKKKSDNNKVAHEAESVPETKTQPHRKNSSLLYLSIATIIIISFLVTIGWYTREQRFKIMEEQIESLQSNANGLQLQLSMVTNQLQKVKEQKIAVPRAVEVLPPPIVNNEGLEARVALLEERVQKQVMQQAKKNEVLSVLLTLREKVDTSSSFEEELDHALDVTETSPELKLYIGSLKPYAKQGIQSLQDLQDNFSHLAGDIISSVKDNKDSTMWDKVKGNLSSVITVRRVGDIEGDGIDARVARIEYLLEGGDLEQAIAQAKQLQGEQAKVVAEWLTEAEGTLLAQQMFNAIHKLMAVKPKHQQLQEQIEEVQEEKAQIEIKEEVQTQEAETVDLLIDEEMDMIELQN